MPTDDSRIFPTLSWTRFKSDFPIPESDDAQRVANEVRASMDSWIHDSLAKLEADMDQRAQLAASRLNANINASNTSLTSIQSQIDKMLEGLKALNSKDPDLDKKISDLVAQTGAARDAMQKEADNWKANGQNTVTTIESIIGTVAKAAAA